jgi:hypothetical protein
MKFGLFVFESDPTQDQHLDGFDEYSNDPDYLVKTAKMMMQDFKDEAVPGTFSFEVWGEDENGEYGMQGEPYWQSEVTSK